MATPPLQAALNKWAKLASGLKSAGVDMAPVRTLAQTDIKNVVDGGSGLSTNELVDQLAATIHHTATVNPQAHPDTGLLGTLGNFASDVGSAAFNFLPGVAHLAFQNPNFGGRSDLAESILGKLPGLGATVNTMEALGFGPPDVVAQEKAATHQEQSDLSPGGLASALRNVSRLPLAGIVPGLHTAASLTTEQGRSELAAHPGFTTLDVLPAAAKLGKVAAAGTEAESLSAREALQTGNPIKAAARAVYDPLAAHTPLPTREAIVSAIDRTSLSPTARDLIMKPMASTNNLLHHNFQKFMKEDWLSSLRALPQERQNAIWEAATHGDLSSLSTTERSLVMAADAANSFVRDKGLASGDMVAVPSPAGGWEYYSSDSPVANLYTRVNANLTRLDVKANLLRTAEEAHQSLVAEVGDTPTPYQITRIAKSQSNLSKRQSMFAATQSEALGRFNKFLKKYQKDAPQSYHPLIEQHIRAKVQTAYDTQARSAVGTVEYNQALNTINESTQTAQLRALIGDKEYKTIEQSSRKMWTDIAATTRPLYVHNVPSGATEFVSPSIFREPKYETVGAFRNKSFNLGSSVHNIAISVESNMADYIRAEGNRAFVDTHVMPLTKTGAELDTLYRDTARSIMQGHDIPGYRNVRELVNEDVAGLATRLMEKDYVKYDPAVHGFGGYITNLADKTLYLPKGVAASLSLMKSGADLPFIGRYSPLTKLFKYSVLTGPRHMAHIGFGGLVMGAGREPGFLTELSAASRITKEQFWPEIMQRVNDLGNDHIYAYASGKTQGRLLGALKGVPEAMSSFEERLTNMYKVAATLSAEKRGLSHADALEQANKIFVDVNALSAFEQTWVKSVMPFYAFSRHIMRYLATYPIDHPVRAAVLSNLAANSEAANGNSLPGTYANLFFLGGTDPSGNVTAIDFKSLNPFRSTYSLLTMAGAMSSLNPAFQSALTAAGVDTLSATPELHPDLQVDPQTGQLVAKHDVKNILTDVASAFVPESRALTDLIGYNDKLKYLRANDPEAFHRMLWSSLNLPFSISSYNLDAATQKLEGKRYLQAQKDLSAALKSNDFSTIRSYNILPVPKYLQKYLGNKTYATPADIEALWSKLRAATGGTLDPKAILR